MNKSHLSESAAPSDGSAVAASAAAQLALALVDLVLELRPRDRLALAAFRRRIKRRLRDASPELEFYRTILRALVE